MADEFAIPEAKQGGNLADLVRYILGVRDRRLSAALVYRLVSFWLVISLGWITVVVIARRQAR